MEEPILPNPRIEHTDPIVIMLMMLILQNFPTLVTLQLEFNLLKLLNDKEEPKVIPFNIETPFGVPNDLHDILEPRLKESNMDIFAATLFVADFKLMTLIPDPSLTKARTERFEPISWLHVTESCSNLAKDLRDMQEPRVKKSHADNLATLPILPIPITLTVDPMLTNFLKERVEPMFM
jgi:hypothetical protein